MLDGGRQDEEIAILKNGFPEGEVVPKRFFPYVRLMANLAIVGL